MNYSEAIFEAERLSGLLRQSARALEVMDLLDFLLNHERWRVVLHHYNPEFDGPGCCIELVVPPEDAHMFTKDSKYQIEGVEFAFSFYGESLLECLKAIRGSITPSN